MNPFPYIDTHVHLWDPQRLRYGWLGGVPPLNRCFLPGDFRSAAGPVAPVKVVFVECGRDPDQNVEEADWVADQAVGAPWIAGVVAHAAVEKGDGVMPELEALARRPLVRGVRRLLQDEGDAGFCLRPGFVQGVRRLGEFGFTFDLCIYAKQLPAVTGLVEACPEVRFVLDHLGKPGVREGRFGPWSADVARLAALPNVVCKLSGLATEADHARWTEAELRPYLEHVLGCFGPGRVMFGGDWPVSTLATSYPRWLQTVLGVAGGLGEEDLRRLFVDNAVREYRLA